MSWIVNASGDLAALWMVRRNGHTSTERRASFGPRCDGTPLLKRRRDPRRSANPSGARRSSIIALLLDADLPWAA
jgi:hypothetical protein